MITFLKQTELITEGVQDVISTHATSNQKSKWKSNKSSEESLSLVAMRLWDAYSSHATTINGNEKDSSYAIYKCPSCAMPALGIRTDHGYHTEWAGKKITAIPICSSIAKKLYIAHSAN